MKTVKENKTQEKAKLEPLCSLWEATSKDGDEYLTGTTEDKRRIVAFYNFKKKNKKEPDIRVYLSNDNNEE